MQTWLAQQLPRCVLAHLTHIQDCKEYAWLLGGGEKARAPSYFPRYMAEDMCSRLAAMCRHQNYYGSLAGER